MPVDETRIDGALRDLHRLTCETDKEFVRMAATDILLHLIEDRRVTEAYQLLERWWDA